MKKFMLIEGCNYIDCPSGGQLNFAKQLISQFGTELILVGISTDINSVIGEWTNLEINGNKIPFFPFRYRKSETVKSFLPQRLNDFMAIKRYRKEILSFNSENVFIQSPELLIAISNWGWKNICYSFPGVENPLEMPRYKWGVYFSKSFDRFLFRALRKVNVVLARADYKSISRMIQRSNGLLNSDKVFQFPTRVDTEIFYPKDETLFKESLGINKLDLVFISCGRINKVKGWDLILESFEKFRIFTPNCHLYYVGDGEDRLDLENLISRKGLIENVHITGFRDQREIAMWMNIADLLLVGSFHEGWPTVMAEAIACGLTIISTEVSGARDMIEEGENGFIVKSRNLDNFSSAINKGLELKNVDEKSRKIAAKYSLSSLRIDLDRLWKRE